MKDHEGRDLLRVANMKLSLTEAMKRLLLRNGTRLRGQFQTRVHTPTACSDGPTLSRLARGKRAQRTAWGRIDLPYELDTNTTDQRNHTVSDNPRHRVFQPCAGTWNAHPRYASAAVRNTVRGGEGNRSKPKCRLRIPEPRRTTRYGLADGDNGKRRVARA
jgi:hypothetical protein